MNRRDFLACVAAVPLAAVVPVRQLLQPGETWGDFIAAAELELEVHDMVQQEVLERMAAAEEQHYWPPVHYRCRCHP